MIPPDSLILGDCLEILKEIPDNSIDLVVTDPPYKTISGGNCNGKNSVRPKGMLSDHTNGVFTHQDIDHAIWIPLIYNKLKDNSHCYIFTNYLNLKTILTIAENAGFTLQNLLVWIKNNCTPNQYYMKNCEYVLFLRKGRAKWIHNIGNSKTAHQFNNVQHKQHPTEKPADLLKFYIENSSETGNIVLDPFCGCGSTLTAAKETNRHYIGIEIDETYYNIAKGRVESAKAQTHL